VRKTAKELRKFCCSFARRTIVTPGFPRLTRCRSLLFSWQNSENSENSESCHSAAQVRHWSPVGSGIFATSLCRFPSPLGCSTIEANAARADEHMSDGTDNVIVDTATGSFRICANPKPSTRRKRGCRPRHCGMRSRNRGWTVVGPLEQSDNSGCLVVTSFWVEVAPTDDDVVCYRVHRVLPNRGESLSRPRSLPLIALSMISVEDRPERIAFAIPFPCITEIFHGNCP
jgi:hypothetical protein